MSCRSLTQATKKLVMRCSVTGGEKPTRQASSRTSEESRKDEGRSSHSASASKCSLNHEGPQSVPTPSPTGITRMAKCLVTTNMRTFPLALFVNPGQIRFSTWWCFYSYKNGGLPNQSYCGIMLCQSMNFELLS